MTSVVISQPMLFPWPGFFEQMMLADVYYYLDDAQFSKGSFTNRIQIKLGETSKWMTIPLVAKGSFQSIRDLREADASWRDKHVDLLRQAFRKAPHRRDALDIVEAVYRHETICDLLIASMEAPARYLGICVDQRRMMTSQIGLTGTSWRRVLDIVQHGGGDEYITGHGAADYLDHAAFDTAGVTVRYMNYSKTPWPQGGTTFTPYVSILDLIAHTGPDAKTFLNPSTTHWRDFMHSKGQSND